MASVLGIGGVFFRSADPAALSQWYREHLGFPVEDWGGAVFRPGDMPAAGYTVWGPFPADTDYFAPSAGSWMLNLVVDDLEGMLARVEAGGARRVGEIERHEYGRFGWFLDPGGNKIELWQPALPPGVD